MTLNSEHDPDSVMMNHYVKYQGQVIVTHNRPNFSAWTHKVVSNYIKSLIHSNAHLHVILRVHYRCKVSYMQFTYFNESCVLYHLISMPHGTNYE